MGEFVGRGRIVAIPPHVPLSDFECCFRLLL